MKKYFIPIIFALLISSVSYPAMQAHAGSVATFCHAPDRGDGTVEAPPIGPCNFITFPQSMVIRDGLPPGTTIEIDTRLVTQSVNSAVPGGTLGGENILTTEIVEMQLTGTGLLLGFNRNLNLPGIAEVDIGPRVPGTSPQNFLSDFIGLRAELPPGDPDFAVLLLTAGSDFGLPSPGSTTLFDIGGGEFEVDSFFDVVYEIEFVGAPGSPLDGLGGTTQDFVSMTAEPNWFPPVCGDGAIDTAAGEQCDPPDGVTCDAACQLIPQPPTDPAVAGELLPMNTSALMIAGLSSMSIWMVPTILGLAGAGIYFVKYRAHKE